ncbi:MAG: hypothetical protein IKD07_04750, partial [Clostridia bacterium]|nr:hypothetical protein [Clostridia bacterium]
MLWVERRRIYRNIRKKLFIRRNTMIKTQKGHLQIKGKAQEIIADLTVIMKGCRELFAVRGYDVDDIFK